MTQADIHECVLCVCVCMKSFVEVHYDNHVYVYVYVCEWWRSKRYGKCVY
jgi:hypothetical protein